MDADRHTNRRQAADDYALAASYEFSRRFAEGKKVADLRKGGPGKPGANLLEGCAASVANGLRPEEFAQHEGRFDVVLAFGEIENYERPEEFVAGAARLLNEGGVLIASTPDRQTHSNERNRPPLPGEMHVPEFRDMLERSFESVSLHRLGAVCGAVVIPENSGLDSSDAQIESADFYSRSLSPSSAPPKTQFVLAVCGGAEEIGEGTLLVLDRGGRAFDEGEEARDDAELLREEIEHMRRTEIQAFADTVRIAASDRVVMEMIRRLGLSEGTPARRALEASLHLMPLLSRAYRAARGVRRRLRGDSDG